MNTATRAGRKLWFDTDQLLRIEKELLRGAAAQGFEADQGRLPRVTTLIERLTGVSYHSGHMWKLLKAMGWGFLRLTARTKNEMI